MFLEIDQSLLKPARDGSKKRWFRDTPEECDLFVWEDEEGNVRRFQFWYQDALIKWDLERGIRTGRIDAKSGAFVNYQSDLYRLHSDIDDDLLDTVHLMLQEGQKNEVPVLEFVKSILHELAGQFS